MQDQCLAWPMKPTISGISSTLQKPIECCDRLTPFTSGNAKDLGLEKSGSDQHFPAGGGTGSGSQVDPHDRPWRKRNTWHVYVSCHVKKRSGMRKLPGLYWWKCLWRHIYRGKCKSAIRCKCKPFLSGCSRMSGKTLPSDSLLC